MNSFPESETPVGDSSFSELAYASGCCFPCPMSGKAEDSDDYFSSASADELEIADEVDDFVSPASDGAAAAASGKPGPDSVSDSLVHSWPLPASQKILE